MKRFLLAFTLLLMACQVLPTMTDVEPLAVPPIYRQWHQELKACSGLQGNFDDIVFYAASHITYGGRDKLGYWRQRHTITMRDDMVMEAWAVKHEMMHDLLNSDQHPDQYFEGVCGDLGNLN